MTKANSLRGGVFDLLRFFLSEGKELTKLVNKFRSITEPINTPSGFTARARVGLEILRVSATYSETEIDDAIVETIGKLLENDDLIAFIVNLIGVRATAPIVFSEDDYWALTFEGELTGPELERVKAAEVDMSTFFEVCRVLLALLRLLSQNIHTSVAACTTTHSGGA